MNIMTLIPQSEYKRLVENKSDKIMGSAQSKIQKIYSKDPDTNIKNDASNNTRPCSNVNQLNQTKIEDGGKQTIINTCKPTSSDDTDQNSDISFPSDSAFNNISSSESNPEIDKDQSENQNKESNDKDTIENQNEENQETTEGYNEPNNNQQNISQNEGSINNQDIINIPNGAEPEENNKDINSRPEENNRDMDNLVGRMLADNLNTEEEKNINQEIDVNENNNLEETNSDIPAPSNIEDTQKTLVKLPSSLSLNHDDKYKLWQEQKKYTMDPELWDNIKTLDAPGDAKDQNQETNIVVDSQNDNINDNADPTGKNIPSFNNPINPLLKIQSRKYKKDKSIKKVVTPYSKTKSTASGTFKKKGR